MGKKREKEDRSHRSHRSGTELPRPLGGRTVPEQISLHHARDRRQSAQDIDEFDGDVATPFDMGTVGAGSPLPTPYVMRANARVAVSFSVALTSGQLTLDAVNRTLGTPVLAADELHRTDVVPENRTITPTSAIAGTVTIHVLDEWQRSFAVATGVFT